MTISKQQRLKAHFLGEWVVIRSRSYHITHLKPYHPIRTHQERAMHELHKKEYRQIRQLKLRARRGKTLPCAWHDINVSAHAYTKSWKHNSKRRKQWYRTNDI